MNHMQLTFADIALRLVLALICGGLIGLNRDLHHKGAGLRTFGLVALGTAGITVGTLMVLESTNDNIGRVMQGVVTGIGFLGAGVIMRRPDRARVTGLTTAAAIWFVAGLAVLCGLGQVELTLILLALAFVLLLGGRPIERRVEQLFAKPNVAAESPDPDGDE
jgi:putative Mg2+ transporter-C (MgtC) family protein